MIIGTMYIVSHAQIAGTWKLAPVETALAVGPGKGDYSWWKVPAAEISTSRTCQFDDEFIFNANGTFENKFQTSTFLEGWMNNGNFACGTPVAPFDGSNMAATWKFNSSTNKLTVYGKGAFVGLPKVYNGGELTSVNDAKDSITYEVTVNGNNMSLDIAISGGYWHFELVKQMPPLDPTGYWKLRPVSTSLAVGPAKNDFGWWKVPASEITNERVCQYDDYFVFNADGSFKNEMQGSTFVEGWMGGSFACASPVAPFDGTANAKWVADKDKGLITLIGKGAFIGMPKAYNGGELKAVSEAKDTVTYEAAIIADTMYVNIGINGGAYWHYELIRTTAPTSGVKNSAVNKIQLFPNPGNGMVNIVNAQTTINQVRVYNLNGQLLINGQISENKASFNANKLAVGTYIVVIDTINGSTIEKFIKD